MLATLADVIACPPCFHAQTCKGSLGSQIEVQVDVSIIILHIKLPVRSLPDGPKEELGRIVHG